jgi:hypothetical protein
MSRKLSPSDILDRTSFSLFIIDIPHLRGQELHKAVQNYLVGLYPDNLEQYIVLVRKNGRKKWSYLVFILKKTIIKKPLPVSTLFISRRFSGKDSRVIYCNGGWIEFIQLSKEGLVKSAVKLREDFNFEENIRDFFGPDLKDIDIFCTESERIFISGLNPQYKITIHALEKELGKLPKYKVSLFEQYSGEKKLQKVLLFIFIAGLLAGAGRMFYQYRKSIEEETIRNRQSQEARQRQIEAEQREQQRLIELQTRYNSLVEGKTAGPYETAEVISGCFNERGRIQSLTIKEGDFQLEAYAPDALAVLSAFEKDKKIRNPMLQQIHPLNGEERFSISGTVLPAIGRIEPDLPVKEKIVILENAIAEMESVLNGRAGISPSLFGVNIRSLLLKWGCTIQSYQYLSIQDKGEIEFSINVSSGRFFSFLREASLNDTEWIFTLVQIRNLAPQNSLDIVFRVNSDALVTETLDLPLIQEEDGRQPPDISLISRRFYIPPPPAPPRVIMEPPPAEPPPPPQKAEPASWLEYLGTVSDNTDSQFIYVKNTRSGTLLKLVHAGEGDMRYSVSPMGNIEAYIDGKLYEIRRR